MYGAGKKTLKSLETVKIRRRSKASWGHAHSFVENHSFVMCLQ